MNAISRSLIPKLRVTAATLALTLAAAGTASATGYPIGTKTPVDPSFSCRDFDTAGLLSELVISPIPEDVTLHSDGTLDVATAYYFSSDGWVLDWYQLSSGQAIHHVLVQGPNGAYDYSYDPPVTEDRNLAGTAVPTPPYVNPKYEGLDKASFCYSTPHEGVEGCTLGYWKVPKHHDSWPWPYTTGSSLQSAFGANAFNDTFLTALNYKGGPGIDGAKRILLKQAVASLLNAASGGVEFPLTTQQVIDMTTFALGSNDRDVMISLSATLDAYNNMGCPLN
ncbi:hypothetical protein CSC71_03400 [Pseudoxanthomonas sangjuensis]|uniref:hypothetical protein n=1 Tax=Pseudoxanthomonas sangjuensis TaxID=1503750 RepID=UPI001391B40D|nr:hypothetical protein [Pseudoxanthomonas sangjuensis]KAF1714820.1 hypothetical protein CSC71_03400 [Pseudoxanthomonas sangjuensis]